jgi:sarcosine oxidase gamma subunit
MTLIQPRRGTAAQWTSANPVLEVGELGFETDTGKEKRGDGTSDWTELEYRPAPGELPLFIDVKSAPYGVTPATSSPEVGIQAAIDYAADNGIPEVIISKPGTYTVGLRLMPGSSTMCAAIWGRPNVKLTMKPGVVIKLKNAATVAGGTIVAHIISVINPYGGATNTNWSIEGGVVDCNGANQSSLLVQVAVSLARCESSFVKDVTVKNLYGTGPSYPGESLHFDALNCRDVAFINCTADGSGTANTATGFSSNNSYGVSWTGCVSHGMGFGMGFTVWQSAGCSYANCRAYDNAYNGFNAERSENVTYAGCIAGGRTPFIGGTDPENPFYSGGQTALGNGHTGFSVSGCTDVTYSGCVATYNLYNFRAYSNVGISPTLINTRVLATGCDFRSGTTGNVYIETVGLGGLDQVEVLLMDCLGAVDGATDWVYNYGKTPVLNYDITGTSGLRWWATGLGASTWAYRWSREAAGGGTVGTIGSNAMAGITTAGQFATSGRLINRRATAVNATITLLDDVIAVTDTSAARTITLPVAATAGAGATYLIKDESGAAATNNITIARGASDLIEGATSVTINVNYGWVRVMSTGTTWMVVNKTAPITTTADTAATASTLAQRDSNANLKADAFIATKASTVTAAGTTTLTIADPQVQIFTGSTTQTVLLPTTGVTGGQQYTIVNQSSGNVAVQSSGANAVATVAAGMTGFFIANADTPTTAAHWQAFSPWMYSTANTLAMRDSFGNLVCDVFVSNATSTATSAGTLTMSINDRQTQVFTGSTTHTVKLPTTAIIAGQQYTVINQSSGAVAVQSSGANSVASVAAGAAAIFLCVFDTPTTAAHWKTVFNA